MHLCIHCCLCILFSLWLKVVFSKRFINVIFTLRSEITVYIQHTSDSSTHLSPPPSTLCQMKETNLEKHKCTSPLRIFLNAMYCIELSAGGENKKESSVYSISGKRRKGVEHSSGPTFKHCQPVFMKN